MEQGNDSMAIIRIAASTGAALLALALLAVMAIAPAASQAQALKAPLQLVPGPDQAKPTTRPGATKSAKAASNKVNAGKPANTTARTAASGKNARHAVTVARPSPTAVRTSAKPPTANTVASRRQSDIKTNAQRARGVNAPKAVRAAAGAPHSDRGQEASTLRILAARIFAQGGDPAIDNVMRDGDSISLVARLPWWRNDRLQDVQYGSVEAEDAVMAAAAVWIAASGGEREPSEDRAPGRTLTLASPEEAIEVADTGTLNELDLAAGEGLPPPAPTFLQSLVALIGGIAAAAAASVRFLFA
jgi:hypothetical protein